MAGDKYIELQTGVDTRFQIFYVLVFLLAFLGLVFSDTGLSLKLTTVTALLLFCCFTSWKIRQREANGTLRIYGNGAVTLIGRNGVEIYGILEPASWVTRSVSLVKVGLFDRWRQQQLLVCASRNSASNYRHLLKQLRHNSGNRVRDGILSG
jgi:hypothetical protein